MPNPTEVYSIISSGSLYKRVSLDPSDPLTSLRKEIKLRPEQIFLKNGAPYSGDEDTAVGQFADEVRKEDDPSTVVERRIEIGTCSVKIVRKGKPLTSIPLKSGPPTTYTLLAIRKTLGKEMQEWERFLVNGAPCRPTDEAETLVMSILDSKAVLEIGLPETDPLPAKLPIPEWPAPSEDEDDKKDKPSAELPSQLLDIVTKEVIASENVDDVTELTDEERNRIVAANLLLHGIDVQGPKPRVATKPALERSFAKDAKEIVFLRQDQTEITAELTYTERGKNLVESGFKKADAGLSTPWVAGSFEASVRERTASDHKEKQSFTIGRWQCHRAIVVLEKSSVVATAALVDAVTPIVDDHGTSDDFKYDRLQDVFNEWGHVIPTRFVLGAELMQTKQETASADVAEHDREGKMRASVSADAGTFFSAKAGLTLEESRSEGSTEGKTSSRSQYAAKGGNTLFATDPVHWLDSVKRWQSWRIIAYEDVRPIYMFFDTELREKVIAIVNAHLQSEMGDIWGMSMLPSGTTFAISGKDQSLWRLEGRMGFWQRINVVSTVDGVYPNRFSDVAALSEDRCVLLTYESNQLAYASIAEGKADILLFNYDAKVFKSLCGNAIAALPSGRGIICCPPHTAGTVPTLLRLMDFGIDKVGTADKYTFRRLDMASAWTGWKENMEILSVAAFDNDKYVVLFDDNGKSGQRRCLKCLDAREGKWSDISISPRPKDILCIAATPEDYLLVVYCDKVESRLWPFMFVSEREGKLEERHGWRGSRIVTIRDWQQGNGDTTSNLDVANLRNLALAFGRA